MKTKRISSAQKARRKDAMLHYGLTMALVIGTSVLISFIVLLRY